MALHPVAIRIGAPPPARHRTRPEQKPERELPPARHRTRQDAKPLDNPSLARPQTRPSGSKNAREATQLIALWRAGSLNPSTITNKEEVSLRRFCRQQVRHWQIKIDRLLEAGSFRAAERASRQMRRKLGVRLHALLDASRKAIPYHPLRTPCLEMLRLRRLELAFEHLKDINSFRHGAEAVVRKKAKASGRGFRSVCLFKWTDQARQYLLEASLQPFAGFHPSQTLLRLGEEGRGITAARKALLKNLEGCGDEHVFVQIDVQDFFGSISYEWLEGNLPLDQGTIRRHVHTGEMNLKFRDTACQKVRLSRTARRGIPQGSALSQLIAEMVMADVLRGVAAPLGVRIVAYSDNIGIVMPKGSEAAVEELVRAAFQQHKAGPFTLTFTKPIAVTGPFDFLGMSFGVFDGVPTAVVPERVWGKWLLEIGGEVLVANATELEDIRRKVRSKVAQWCIWAGASALEAEALKLVDCGYDALALANEPARAVVHAAARSVTALSKPE